MPETRRIVLAHGFTQTARSWDVAGQAIRAALPDTTEVVAVDLPGHGSAGAVMGDLWAAADHLVAVGRSGVYVGYSMGGRVALHAVLAHPQRMQGLVLIGANAGIDDETERAARRAADERLAAHLEEVGLDRFIDEWLASPLFAGLTPETAQRDDRLRNSAGALAHSLRSSGTGTQIPLWSRLGEIRVPTLVIAGEDDAKFRALGDRLAAAVPNGTLEVIPGCGHSVHLEQPLRTAHAIVDWLEGTGLSP